MTDDLGSMIRAAVHAETDAAARAYPYTPDTSTRFRREARRRRVAGGAAVATACALVAGAAAVAVAQPWATPVPPATTATPDPTQTTSPQPTPGTPTTPPTEAAVIGTVTVDPHLPAAEPLRQGVLAGATAGSGWAMLEYSGDVDTESGPVDGPEVLYLMAPDGKLTQVADLTDPDAAVSLEDWLPGTDRVLLHVRPLSDGGHEVLRVLDIETGAVEGEIPVADGAYDVRASFTQPTGRNVVVWQASGETVRVTRYSAAGKDLGALVDGVPSDAALPAGYLYAPDGTFVVVGGGTTFERVPVDGAKPTTIARPDGTLGCAPVRWWSDGRLLATCADDGGPDTNGDPDGTLGMRLSTANLWLFDVGGVAQPERLTAYVSAGDVDFGLEDAWDVGGTRFAQWSGDCGGMALGVSDGAAFTRLADKVWVYGPWHDGFVGTLRPSCGDPYAELVSVGRDGAVTSLVPRVDGAYGVGRVVLP